MGRLLLHAGPVAHPSGARASKLSRSHAECNPERAGVTMARQLGGPATLGYALVGRVWAIYWPEGPEERLELAEELIRVGEAAGDGERAFDGYVAKCMTLYDLGAIAEANAEMLVLRSGMEEGRGDAERATAFPGVAADAYPAGFGADGSVCHRPNSFPPGSLQTANHPMLGTGIPSPDSPPSSLTRATPALMSSTSK